MNTKWSVLAVCTSNRSSGPGLAMGLAVALAVALFGLMAAVLAPSANAESKLVYSLDFSQAQDGDALEWLASHGFKSLLGADDLRVSFKDSALSISTNAVSQACSV